MKSILAAATLIAIGAVPASAADMAARPYTKAPAMAPMYDWSGFYIGANGGGATNRSCSDNTGINFGAGIIPVAPALSDGCHDATGATAGGQVGYRWQKAAWVFGVEAQGNWADLRGGNLGAGTTFNFGVPTEVRSNIDALGLFTGQIGYSWNSALLYVKGGAAVTRNRYESATLVPIGAFGLAAGAVLDRASDTRWGGVVGVGVEYGFAPNWSVALEYDHLFLGSHDQTFRSVVPTFLPAGALFRTERIRDDVDMLTARLNYRFNWGGPIVAKY